MSTEMTEADLRRWTGRTTADIRTAVEAVISHLHALDGHLRLLPVQDVVLFKAARGLLGFVLEFLDSLPSYHRRVAIEERVAIAEWLLSEDARQYTELGPLVAKAILEKKYVKPDMKGDTGLLLPGWTCGACRAFNGSAKEELTQCRCCGVSRPKEPTPRASRGAQAIEDTHVAVPKPTRRH